MPSELLEAIEDLDIERVGRLLDAGVDPNAQSKHGWPPIHHAIEATGDNCAQNGVELDTRLVDLLLTRGALASTRDAKGWDAADHAAFYGMGDTARFLELRRDWEKSVLLSSDASRGTHRLACQLQGRGVYAEVDLLAQEASEPSVRLGPKPFAWLTEKHYSDVQEKDDTGPIGDGAVAGATFALNEMGAPAALIAIVGVRVHPTLSSEAATAYASCRAAWMALRHTPNERNLDAAARKWMNVSHEALHAAP